MQQMVAQRDAILKNDGLPVPLNPNDPAIHPYKMAGGLPHLRMVPPGSPDVAVHA